MDNSIIYNALRDNILNLYHGQARPGINPNRTLNNIVLSSRYYNNPPNGGYQVDEEHDYIINDIDDISSILFLDIVTQFGSPGSDSVHLERRKSQIKNIQYKKVKERDSLTEVQCPICIENFSLGEYHKTLNCQHVFHKKCIDRWFKRDHSDCPMCRTKIIFD